MLIKNEISRRYSKNQFYKVIGEYGGYNRISRKNVEVLSNKNFEGKEKTKVKTYSKKNFNKKEK